MGGVCVPQGLFDLCNPAPVIRYGEFLIQWPNVIWLVLLLVLVVLGVAVQMPGAAIPTGETEEEPG